MESRRLPDLLTVKQASQILGVHPNTLRNWDRKGKLNAVRVGTRRDRRFRREDVLALAGRDPSESVASVLSPLADETEFTSITSSWAAATSDLMKVYASITQHPTIEIANQMRKTLEAIDQSLIENIRSQLDELSKPAWVAAEILRVASIPYMSSVIAAQQSLLRYETHFSHLLENQRALAKLIQNTLPSQQLISLRSVILDSVLPCTTAIESLAESIGKMGSGLDHLYEQSITGIRCFQDFSERMLTPLKNLDEWQRAFALESTGVAAKVMNQASTAWQNWPTIEPVTMSTIPLQVPNLYDVFEQELISRDWPKTILPRARLKQEIESSPSIATASIAQSVVELRIDISKRSRLASMAAIFKPTTDTEMISNLLPQTVATSEDQFKEVVDWLFKLIYESSGELRRILPYLSEDECKPVFIVKWLRTYFFHDLEHGQPSEIRRKFALVGKIFQSWVGSPLPSTGREWIDCQRNLLDGLHQMLLRLRTEIRNQ